MASSGMLRRVALVITDVSGELSAPFIRVIRIGELGTTQKTPFFIVTAVKTSNLTLLVPFCRLNGYQRIGWM
jgi:uncharacterized membrane protein